MATNPLRTAVAAPTAEEARLEVIPCMAGHWHTHQHQLRSRTIDEAVLILVLAGQGWYRLGTAPERPVSAGDALYLPPRVDHGYGCAAIDGWRIRWLHFRGSYAESLARCCGFSPGRPVLTMGDNIEPAQRHERILELIDSRSTFCQLDAAVELMGLLVALKKCDQGRLGEDARLIAAVEQGGGLEAMATAAGLSRFHFVRRFKRATGTTPWRYLLDLRLAKAKNLLTDPACTIAAAAHASGFADPAYFARLFRQRTGRSPRAFRAEHCPLPG